MSVDVRPARPDEHPALIAALANAFEEDPVVNWVIRKDAQRRAALERLFASALRIYAPLGMVFTDHATTGCAMWAPPNRWRLGLYRQIALLLAMAFIGGWRRLRVCAKAVHVMEREHPERPHLYLYQLGVDPKAQGRGIGAELMRHGLALADRDRLPAYLETGNGKNLGFYRHFGFEVAGTAEVGVGAPPLWLMWRPRTAR